MLEIKNLTKHFRGVTAVKQLDIHIESNSIVGLIGPNGAGKSTVFNLITGVCSASEGSITFEGKDLVNKKPHTIASYGIGRTFQLNLLFGEFTVLENVTASFQLHPKSRVFDIYFHTRQYRRNEREILRQSLQILELLGLLDRKDTPARYLSHGHQKMLGIARALATKPKLLLLDEPLGGMNPDEINLALEAIKKAYQQGVTIFLVEHNMKILDFCQRIIVMNFGKKIAEGTPAEIRKNQTVITAYLGRQTSANNHLRLGRLLGRFSFHEAFPPGKGVSKPGERG
jgi:branched-chain amino acid transport system ATP-binding protein